MPQVLSLRLSDRMAERLDRFARRLGNGMTRSRAGILLLEEALREAEFACIEYRDSPVGRQPYMKGSGLAIWEVVLVARRFDLDAERMAEAYPYPTDCIKAALNYYAAYREEVDQAIEDNAMRFEAVRRLLPGVELAEAAGRAPGEH